MNADWLTRRLDREQAEAQNMVCDERLGPEPVPFGFCNGAWRHLLAQVQPGDELWAFASPGHSWSRLCGRGGIALLRNGQVVASILTDMS